MSTERTDVRIVLVGTTHPGNVGAAARAMKTMGLDRLFLVAPARFPHADALAMASGADDVLESARICANLDEALAECTLAIASTARSRSYAFPMLEPREAAQMLVAEGREAPVALLFGPEHSGLSNRELDRCQFSVHIPCDPMFSSLNLAAAVQVLCYEIRLAARNPQDVPLAPSGKLDDRPASAEELEGFYAHMEEALVKLQFLDPHNPKHLMRRLRLLFSRTRLSRTEVNILRGILRATRAH